MVAIVLPVTLVNARMLSPANLVALSMDAALLMIVAVAQMLVLITRNIDLSVASVIGLAAYGAAVDAAGASRSATSSWRSGWPPASASPAGSATGSWSRAGACRRSS